jgi:hypothetical protein
MPESKLTLTDSLAEICVSGIMMVTFAAQIARRQLSQPRVGGEDHERRLLGDVTEASIFAVIFSGFFFAFLRALMISMNISWT